MSDVTPTPITSVLVANRGEIARRVFRTATAMGLRTTAVHVDADADAPYVREAEHAVRLATGYLDGDAILAAARRVGAVGRPLLPAQGLRAAMAHLAQGALLLLLPLLLPLLACRLGRGV